MDQGREWRDQVDSLSCRSFAANAVRPQLHALAYNLGNFMRMLAIPKAPGQCARRGDYAPQPARNRENVG
jgi:hypothetical protein